MEEFARRNRILAASVLLVGAALICAMQVDAQRTFPDYRHNARVLLQATTEAPRIWAHRVNSRGDLDEAKQLFAGVELDVVFEPASHSFVVRHPPHRGTGLSLEEYLKRSADRPALRLWLDWKNPTPQNLGPALAELARLDATHGIRGRALVETPSEAVFPQIRTISQQGYLHGYYLPTERAAHAMQQGPGKMAQLGAEMRAAIVQGGYGAVTYDARLQPFVDRQLDDFLQRRKLHRFSWDPRINSSDPATDPAKLSQITSARHLDALLISFPSKFRI